MFQAPPSEEVFSHLSNGGNCRTKTDRMSAFCWPFSLGTFGLRSNSSYSYDSGRDQAREALKNRMSKFTKQGPSIKYKLQQPLLEYEKRKRLRTEFNLEKLSAEEANNCLRAPPQVDFDPHIRGVQQRLKTNPLPKCEDIYCLHSLHPKKSKAGFNVVEPENSNKFEEKKKSLKDSLLSKLRSGGSGTSGCKDRCDLQVVQLPPIRA